MKVLLTGHRGYIGSVLTPMLLERGHDVVGYDIDLFKGCDFTDGAVEIPTINKDTRDVAIEDLTPDHVAGFDAIIHLAALSNDPMGDYRENLTEEINLDASVRLAELGKQAGVRRYLFASSCSNYGASKQPFLDESSEFNPVTAYGKSKVGTEFALAKLADVDFSPTYLRGSTVYGLSPRLRMDLVVNNLTAHALTTGKVAMKSDGTPWRPIVHVEDISLAYIACLEAERTLVHNEAFNIGSTNENYQIREIAETVRDVVPNSEVSFMDGASPDARNYRVDCNKIARKLHGFKPQWTMKRGVEQLYEAYVDQGLTEADLNGEKLNRIRRMKSQIDSGALTVDLRPADADAAASNVA